MIYEGVKFSEIYTQAHRIKGFDCQDLGIDSGFNSGLYRMCVKTWNLGLGCYGLDGCIVGGEGVGITAVLRLTSLLCL